MNSFGQRLRELRKKHNFSQTELGNLTGIHFSHISRYERGAAQPTAETLTRIADALKIPVAALLEDDQSARMKDSEFRSQLEEAESLPDEERHILKRLIGAFLFQYRVRSLPQ